MEIFHYLKHPSKQKRGTLTCLEILDCTLKLMEENNFSYERVTLKELSVLTGHSIGTIYRYFNNKDELLASLWGYLLSKVHTGAVSLIDAFPINGVFELLVSQVIDHYLNNLKHRDVHQMIALYRLFIKSANEPELIHTSIDILIPSFKVAAKKNMSGTFPKLQDNTMSMLLRGFFSMASSPFLEKNPNLYSEVYRTFLVKTVSSMIKCQG
jgi:AcrR family transcriptional regulator